VAGLSVERVAAVERVAEAERAAEAEPAGVVELRAGVDRAEDPVADRRGPGAEV
jgi:hypothetical protein